MAETSHRSWFSRVMTTFAGYPFASMISIAAIYGMVEGMTLYVAIGVTIFLVYNLLFWVRNISGWLWTLSAIAMLYGLYMSGYSDYFEWALLVIVISLWVQALFTSWTIFLISIKDQNNAGDATLLAKMTYVPAVLWGLVFAIQGTLLFGVGLHLWMAN